jgi:hypothetical protein
MILDLQVIQILSCNEYQNLLELMEVTYFVCFFFKAILAPFSYTFLPDILESCRYVTQNLAYTPLKLTKGLFTGLVKSFC